MRISNIRKTGIALVLALSLGVSAGCTRQSSYYYGDPKICTAQRGLCPLVIGAAVVGIAAALVSAR